MRDNKKYKNVLDIKYLTDPQTGKDRKNRLSLSAMLVITTICLSLSIYAIYLAHIVTYNMTYK